MRTRIIIFFWAALAVFCAAALSQVSLDDKSEIEERIEAAKAKYEKIISDNKLTTAAGLDELVSMEGVSMESRKALHLVRQQLAEDEADAKMRDKVKTLLTTAGITATDEAVAKIAMEIDDEGRIVLEVAEK